MYNEAAAVSQYVYAIPGSSIDRLYTYLRLLFHAARGYGVRGAHSTHSKLTVFNLAMPTGIVCRALLCHRKSEQRWMRPRRALWLLASCCFARALEER